MFKHTIFDLLKYFSVKEKNKLTDFISSPYFNKSKTVTELYNELMKYYPSFTQDELTKENLYRKLIRRSNYKDSTMRKLLHDLQELLLEFLIHERFRSMKGVRDDYLLKELMFRNQKLFERNVKRIEYDIANSCISNEYFYDLFMLEANKFNFRVVNIKDNKMKNVDDILQGYSNEKVNCLIYYLIEILNKSFQLIFLGYNYNINWEDNITYSFIENLDIDDIIKNLRRFTKNVFLLEMYYLMYKALIDINNHEYYFEYRNLVSEYSDKLNLDAKYNHYAYLVNYCLIKINTATSGKKKFEQELMDLYEIILKKGYYMNDKIKHLTRVFYRNVFFLGVVLKESRWLLKCINEYSEKLHPDDKDNMRNYGYAFYYNLQEDYEKSLDYINKVSLDIFIFKLDMKNLKLKNFFELNYIEEALSLIHSYRENLRYNKMLTKDRKLSYRNFLLYFERILLYKIGKINVDIGIIKKKLNSCDNVVSKEWLLEKIEEIEIGV